MLTSWLLCPTLSSTTTLCTASGDETNAKISVKYADVTYSQATVKGTAALALGGNAKLTFADVKANVDFTVFNIKKYKGALKGHYEGNVTRL